MCVKVVIQYETGYLFGLNLTCMDCFMKMITCESMASFFNYFSIIFLTLQSKSRSYDGQGQTVFTWLKMATKKNCGYFISTYNQALVTPCCFFQEADIQFFFQIKTFRNRRHKTCYLKIITEIKHVKTQDKCQRLLQFVQFYVFTLAGNTVNIAIMWELLFIFILIAYHFMSSSLFLVQNQATSSQSFSESGSRSGSS